MKNIILLILILLPLMVISQTESNREEIYKNFLSVDIGYSYSSNQNQKNIFGKKKNPSGIFKQFQYSRNVHRFFDIYVGMQSSNILPTTNVLANTGILSPRPEGDTVYLKQIERENSMGAFVGFSFIPVLKRMEWKINQDIGYNHISEDYEGAVINTIGLPSDPDFVLLNAVLPFDEIYHTINYGIGTSLTYNINKRLLLGVNYRSNLAFKMGKLDGEYDDRFFYNSHHVSLKLGVRF